MDEYFEIYGNLIKFSEIKEYKIVQREFIYRPNYIEAEKTLLNSIAGKKYQFAGMQPYAAIIGESGHKSSIEEYKTKNFKESVGKELIQGAITTIGDKFNIKAFRAKKYVCVNQSGRRFTTYLEDIPALVMRQDGKATDVYQNDKLYPLLGESIAPAINLVHALLIRARDEYIFYGNGIQIDDVSTEYERLKQEISLYQEEKEKMKFGTKIRKALPHKLSPDMKKGENSLTERDSK